jgi:putative ABC transport system permease protein
MDTLGKDLRYAARLLRKSPGFTLTAIVVIAIGIGANGAIFSLVDAVLLRPLPYAKPEQLVRLWEHAPGNDRNAVSPLNFLDWSEQNKAFSSMAAVSGASKTLTRDGAAAERIPGQAVTQSFFDLLGVKPVLGRTFTADDFVPNSQVVVISEGFWKSHLGGSAAAIGSTLMLNDRPKMVVGVVPSDFQIWSESQLWEPYVVGRSPEQRKIHYLRVFGRLKPDLTLEQARANMATVAANLAEAFPETNKDWGVTVESLRQATIGADLRTTSLVLAGVAAFVLLMGCANVASLLLARGIGRTREIAVRASLGGSPARIAQQLLTESTLLAALGGVAGMFLAWTIVRAAPAFLPPDTLPVGVKLILDLRVIAFAAVATLATGLLFGLAPAWQASRLSLADTLRAGGRGSTRSAGFRTILAAGEIAIAVMLVAGAGLLLRTIVSLDHVDPGFHAPNVLTMQVSPPNSRYKDPAQTGVLFQRMEREISAIPGVKSVGFSTVLPLEGWDIGQPFTVVGAPPAGSAQAPSANYQMVNPRYFDTLGIAVIRGRAFSDQDTAQSQQVCVVNEELVRAHLQGREPIGTHLVVSAMGPTGPKSVEREIVGVIRQVKVEGLGETVNSREVYVPLTQNSWYWSAIAVRTDGNPLGALSSVKEAIAHVDKDLPVTRVRTMEEVASETVAQPRFRAGIVGAFAALALVLAAVGIFGLLAFSASQRTREFGIRMALGARAGNVLAMVLRGGLAITAAGVAVGVLGAAALTRSLATLLYGVQPLDPLAFGGAALALVCVALSACAIPAWRASRTNPAIALHEE